MTAAATNTTTKIHTGRTPEVSKIMVFKPVNNNVKCARHICKTAKSKWLPHVFLSKCTNSVSTEWILVKFYMEGVLLKSKDKI